ncbi:MAG: hypothetical protein AVDCRST_MAG53-2441 [uncultured Solirubrobacteraceae bacterium]|uniref:DUF4446 family protein n=1 Tax=uncultured Solirubrobacteraceae bacterium TaxID=1162706 RepID=A0A6J4SWA6_9ACTN|nr:MAG: hypothetical protein AVDCRST_MAG53-2441 [uncultured Solirubrobacteraceae bacterium]
MAELTSTAGLVALGACVVALAALVVAVGATVGLRRARADQRAVLGEHGRDDLVTHAANLQRDFEALHASVQEVASRLDARLGTAERRLDGAVTHRGLVRYDAYNEMSGRQSTTIALLDAQRSGIVLSSIAHRDQARLYAKQIVAGVSDLQLSPEEEEALRLATDGPVAPRVGRSGSS